MTATTNILISGRIYDATTLKLPVSDRLFRHAWTTPKKGVVIVDAKAVAGLCHAKRYEWRKWRESQPVEFAGKRFHSNEHSGDTLHGELDEARLQEEEEPGSYLLTPGWKAIDGSFHGPLDFAGIKRLFRAFSKHYKEAFASSQAKSVAIDQAAKTGDIGLLQSLYESMQDDIGWD